MTNLGDGSGIEIESDSPPVNSRIDNALRPPPLIETGVVEPEEDGGGGNCTG